MDRRTILFALSVSLAFFGIQALFRNEGEKVEKPKKVVAQNEAVSFSGEEKFYVLENEYIQLVFSNKGGSIAEINLPLKSKNNKSYVKEIDFDRRILEESPNNDRFPMHKAEGVESVVGGYYPLLRRGLNGASLPGDYYAMNVGGGNFSVGRFEGNLIEFRGNGVTKTYRMIEGAPYCFSLDVTVDGEGYWIGSGVPDVEIVGNAYSPMLRIQVTKNKTSEVDTIELPKTGFLEMQAPVVNWISNGNGFFGVIMDPLGEAESGYKSVVVEGNKAPSRLTLIDGGRAYPAVDYPGYQTFLPLKSGTTSFRVFAGPYDQGLLKELDAKFSEGNYNPDYVSALSLQGWFSFISQPFAKFLSFLMQIFYAITRSWAASIVLLTVALRLMMYPLNSWSIKSSAKMQEVAPRVKAIQERYKNDSKRAQIEVMNLYRESGINPLTGCLPVLLQMPFLIGMFYMLKSSFPLRGAVFIPGWIDDLSAPDVLFTWSQPIWFIGTEFHLLPILMGLTMFLQQKFTAKGPQDPSKMNDAQKQQKMMGNMMAVLFTVMFYNFPSGLNIYFMLSTLLGIAQQQWMTKKFRA
jgi:YidC/Oxa1 family membrane protein insertase